MSITRPCLHDFLANPMTGPEIEARSFAIIDAETPDRARFSSEEWEIVRRLVHTTGDFSIAQNVRLSPDAPSAAATALARQAPIFADSNMIRSGLSLARLQELHPAYTREDIVCYVADPEVAASATAQGLPRSLLAMRRARPLLDGGIAIFGNAPVALLELNRLILEEGVRPALVIGMPVGFVHVVESKEELCQLGVPYVVVEGRRGGSPLAVAALHALCTLAVRARKNADL